MNSRTHRQPEEDITVLICAPVGRDAALIHELLREQSIDARVCDTHTLLRRLGAHACGPVVIAEEALTNGTVPGLVRLLDGQPSWSDQPVILLEAQMPGRGREVLTARPSITVLRRPLAGRSLVTVVRAAVEARRRQFEVRHLLEDMESLNQRLKDRARQLQRLSLQLTEAEHRERKRLADILHDHLQQLLVAAKVQLQLHQHGKGELSDAERRVHELLDESVQVSRSLASDLNPPLLHNATLEDSLRWLVSRQTQHALDVDLTIEGSINHIPEKMQMMLFDAVRELLFNVVKHAGVDHATLSVKREPGRGLTAVVADEGKGFDAPALEQKPAGGLGVFRIRERLDYIGGEFTCRSRPGAGCRIEIFLPESLLSVDEASDDQSDDTTAPTAADPAKCAGSTVRILLADDHAVFRQGLKAALNGIERYEVVGEAADGLEAVKLARELRPQVVILDVTMPRMDGIAAAKQIAGEQTCDHIVGLSMHQHEDVAARMRDAGASAYLAKDHGLDRLVDVIRGFTSPEPKTNPPLEPNAAR